MNMNAVGIDVSKWKSTVAILHPGGKVVVKPFDVPHFLKISITTNFIPLSWFPYTILLHSP